jgi:pimeloyl-ACP methyl ester carboxylesterase
VHGRRHRARICHLRPCPFANSHRASPPVPISFVNLRSCVPKILYGQSIGGAVAIDLASRHPTAVCILSFPLLTHSLLYSSPHLPLPLNHASSDLLPHPRKHFHLTPLTHPPRPPSTRALLLPLPPKVGLPLQDRAHPPHVRGAPAQWGTRRGGTEGGDEEVVGGGGEEGGEGR